MMWLMPGLVLKRWIFASLLGVLLVGFGVSLALNFQPFTHAYHLLQQVAQFMPSWLSGGLCIALGLLTLRYGMHKTQHTLSSVTGNQSFGDMAEALLRKNRLSRGPNIVAIGGGTGLSTLLRGLKLHSSNLTAIVTVGDDGGSSGKLREDQGIIPPGDIRNCIAALADEEKLITSLFQYRFHLGTPEGGLQGHSFGNLFLTAMCHVTGDMMSAIKESSRVLNTLGRVLPSTLEQVELVAEMEDGSIVRGESNIPEARKRIRHLSCSPASLKALPEVIEAIQSADLILMGPGSLYTSVLPNLLIPEIREALAKSKVPRLYVANMMSQAGETDQFTVSDHVKVLLEHTQNPQLISAVLVNRELPQALVETYEKAGSHQVPVDTQVLGQWGITVCSDTLVDLQETQTVRHHPARLAKAIMAWFKSVSHHSFSPSVHPSKSYNLESGESADFEEETLEVLALASSSSTPGS
jgi:uncharacterized cofD-like protein